MKRIMIFILGISFWSGLVIGEGLSGADFLKICSSPQSASMGEASVALVSGIGALNFNSAGIAEIKNHEAMFSHIEWLEDVSYEYIAYGQQIFKGVAGMSVTFLHQGAVDNFDMEGNKEGSLNASDLAVTMGYAKKFSSLNDDYFIGGVVKYILRTVAGYNASTFAVDLGCLLKMELLKLYKTKNRTQNFSVGVSLQNVGPGIKFVNESYSLPILLRTGIGYRAYQTEEHSIDLGVSVVNYIIDKITTFNIGIEYNFKETFSIRAGYIISKKIPNNLSIGFGLNREYNKIKYILEFNFSPNNTLGNIYYSSIGVQF